VASGETGQEPCPRAHRTEKALNRLLADLLAQLQTRSGGKAEMQAGAHARIGVLLRGGAEAPEVMRPMRSSRIRWIGSARTRAAV